MADPNWKVYPLVVGEAEVPQVLDVFWSLSKDKSLVTVPILAWLLVSLNNHAEPILVDTGFRDAERCMKVHGLGPHRTRPEWSLKHQLGNHGLELEEVKTFILTHLHYDHAGGCIQLPNARFVIQRSEMQAAAAPMVSPQLEFGGGALFYDRKDIADLVDPLWQQVDLIEGDTEIAPGVKCVLFANTHTPGSQAVYVKTESGTAVILGDIARNIELNINQRIPPGLYYDLEATYRAMIRIKKEADIVLPCHDYSVVKKYANGV
ncbi:MBL fold metallo-hydrolase [Collibacillus ludicampi]|uniref:MBL fold metallo-hydrolase n=1 Tax=Collibacillus ludicampi TaxID=2771369 RepID=A0AAV4LB13_9BACL|nr:N-acyl homoserine lactonase family protein [Collibacillus ludicampi]GIM44961.1 MBL fold metallo-hydrolase [Collibacillus ludicampi]